MTKIFVAVSKEWEINISKGQDYIDSDNMTKRFFKLCLKVYNKKC